MKKNIMMLGLVTSLFCSCSFVVKNEMSREPPAGIQPVLIYAVASAVPPAMASMATPGTVKIGADITDLIKAHGEPSEMSIVDNKDDLVINPDGSEKVIRYYGFKGFGVFTEQRKVINIGTGAK